MTLIILTIALFSWQAKPARLHCSHCDDTYALPQNGTVRIYRELKCPLDDFELLSWSSGHRGKSYPLCPYCYNYPPFRYGILVQLLPSRVYLVISSDLKSKPAPDFMFVYIMLVFLVFYDLLVLFVSLLLLFLFFICNVTLHISQMISPISKLLLSWSVKWC